jgi:hypothetical protein
VTPVLAVWYYLASTFVSQLSQYIFFPFLPATTKAPSFYRALIPLSFHVVKLTRRDEVRCTILATDRCELQLLPAPWAPAPDTCPRPGTLGTLRGLKLSQRNAGLGLLRSQKPWNTGKAALCSIGAVDLNRILILSCLFPAERSYIVPDSVAGFRCAV